MNHAANTPPPVGNAPQPTSPDPIELAMEAVARQTPVDPTARTLLQRQTRLIDMQIQQIRIRRWLAGAAIVLIVAGLGAVLWSAAGDRSLVIQSFTAPPDLEAQGLGGEALASLLLDKLSIMDAQTESIRARRTLTNDWAGDLKVEIPNTGVSLGQLDRGLRHWLGQQTRVEGGVYRSGAQLTVVVRTGGGAWEFSGAPETLDHLLQQAAEAVYGAAQPYQFSKYLEEHGRPQEALAVARRNATSDDLQESAWGNAQIANLLLVADLPGAVEAARRGVAKDPHNALAVINLSGAEAMLGHDEAAWRELNQGARLLEAGGGGLSQVGVMLGKTNEAGADEAVGNYRGALQIYSSDAAEFEYQGYSFTRPGLMAVDLARLHEVGAAAAVKDVAADTELVSYLSFWNVAFLPAYERHAALADWNAALPDLDRVAAVLPGAGYVGQVGLERTVQPLRGLVLAHLGRFAEARQVIGGTPQDCYRCVYLRGTIEALAGDAAASDRWFGQAIHDAPSLPIAFYEWGRAKLARGDIPGAIALLQQAQQNGPHWAEPYKAEGDALMRQNKADQALRCYAKAAERAPHWGGLQLAWGRALEAQRRTAEAHEKYAAAATMDLTVAERAALLIAAPPPG
jgi:tetratricopeptide (TPR) repeat protein